jgi:hypothetical protein
LLPFYIYIFLRTAAERPLSTQDRGAAPAGILRARPPPWLHGRTLADPIIRQPLARAPLPAALGIEFRQGSKSQGGAALDVSDGGVIFSFYGLVAHVGPGSAARLAKAPPHQPPWEPSRAVNSRWPALLRCTVHRRILVPGVDSARVFLGELLGHRKAVRSLEVCKNLVQAAGARDLAAQVGGTVSRVGIQLLNCRK